MSWIESMQRALDYIETHLQDSITIEDIASQAHVSPFHFQRLFTILTDVSVGEYIRRRKMTLAAQELVSGDDKIIDLAYKYGYDTPESFSKAFRKHHGVAPSDVRKGLGKIQSYNRLSIQVELKGALPMNYRIVERENIRIVGVQRQIQCDPEGGSPARGVADFWRDVNEDGTLSKLIKFLNGEMKGPLGVTCNYDHASNSVEYWIGVESTVGAPNGFAVTELPAAKWVVFEVHGPVSTAMPQAWKRIYSEWFPSNGYEPAEQPPIEVYIDANPFSEISFNEIWVPVR